jgi:pyruvate carboxylase
MKMETVIVAKTNGIIKSIKVDENELVGDKQLLMIMTK